jgi:hypothetical protein
VGTQLTAELLQQMFDVQTQNINSCIDKKLDKVKNELQKEIAEERDTRRKDTENIKNEIQNMKTEMKKKTPVQSPAQAQGDIRKLEKEFAELRTKCDQAAQPQPSTAGGSNWQPQFIYVKGFAPFGCGPERKLSPQQYEEEGNKILDLLPTNIKQNMSLEKPFYLNHQLTFRVKAGVLGCRAAADAVQNAATMHDLKIRGEGVKVNIQLSSERRDQFRKNYTAVDHIKAAVPGSYATCARSLKIYGVPSNKVVGELLRGGSTWKWHPEECREIGFDPDVC